MVNSNQLSAYMHRGNPYSTDSLKGMHDYPRQDDTVGQKFAFVGLTRNYSARAKSTDGYRYGFNGKEKNTENNCYDYGFRIYNAQLARFLSTDPLFKSYPWYTPYQFAGNISVAAIDLDGLEEALVNVYRKFGITVLITVTYLNVGDLAWSPAPGKIASCKREAVSSNDLNVDQVKKAKLSGTLTESLLTNVSSMEVWMQNCINKKINSGKINGGVSNHLEFKNPKATVKFDTDVSTVENAKKNMSSEAKSNMEYYAVHLLINPELGLKIDRFADAEGTKIKSGYGLTTAEDHNKNLSENRAYALKEYIGDFLKTKGVDEAEISAVRNRISAVGNGTGRSLDDNPTTGANPNNRVAEVQITNSSNGQPIVSVPPAMEARYGIKPR